MFPFLQRFAAAVVAGGFLAASAIQAQDVLGNGVNHTGTLMVGEVDSWTFEAGAGEAVFLRLASTGVYPRFTVFAPDGTEVGVGEDGQISRDADFSFRPSLGGTFTVLVRSYYDGGDGAYTLHLAKVPGAFTIPGNDEGGVLTNGANHPGELERGDLDLWTFTVEAGDRVRLRMASTGVYPRFSVVAPDGVEVGVGEDGQISRNAGFEFTAAAAGQFTVVARSYYRGGEGTYTLRYARLPPDLIVPGETLLDEGGGLSVPISAQDPELPVKPLVFELLSGPPGAVLSPAGATNATITWTSSEADGPGTVEFTARVTDTVDGVAYRRTNRFAVVVREMNTPPQFALTETQSVVEESLLSLPLAAIDADLPPNPLAYRVLGGPSGAVVDPATGVLTWTPTEAHGPSNADIVVVVTDSSPQAVNATALSATNVVRVTVGERNEPPPSSRWPTVMPGSWCP